MDFLNLNETVKSALLRARGLAREYGNESCTPAHLLMAILHKEAGLRGFISSLDADLDYLREWAEVRVEECPKTGIVSEVRTDGRTADVLERADNVRIGWGLLEVSPLCVLMALVRPGTGFTADELKSFPIREKDIDALFTTESPAAGIMRMKSGPSPDGAEEAGLTSAKGTLFKYCVEKSALALSTDIHPVVDRERELRQMMEILGRMGKPNVLVIGDSGVGKTALVDGLVYAISQGGVPDHLKGARVYELDTGTLIAGATYKGEIEDRLTNVIRELERVEGGILFIDEIQTLLDAKQGNAGAASILKPALSKGLITVIGATTTNEYRKLVEPDKTFSRRFEVLTVEEPGVESAKRMLSSVIGRYSDFHGLGVEPEAAASCVALAKRYVKERRLPDSAIDLLDRTMSAVKMDNETFGNEPVERIGAHHLATMVSGMTGIPIGKIEAGEREKLIHLEEMLRRRVVGQDQALKALADAIVESRGGMNKEGQPIGSFFLLGPTGTGKTELAKALAETLFNDERAMIRFDMSEFKEEHSAALLYGAPPGYVGYEEGGLLVNRIRRQPYAVVLFDEIEKAHPSVYDIFLQIMDEGKLHDRLGKEGDFSNAIVLFTSNVGSDRIAELVNTGHTPGTLELMELMGRDFRPEFLARLSEIVPFAPINEGMLVRVFEIQLRGVTDILGKKGIGFTISEEAKRVLSHKGFTPKYGARQVAGIIRNYIRRPLSKMLVTGKLGKGNTVEVTTDGKGEVVWNVK